MLDSVKFAIMPNIKCRRSRFDMSYRITNAFNNGLLIPIGSPIEVLPGDTFSIDVNAFIRMNPTINVPLDDIYCDIYAFFVPNRIVWSHWKEFMGENRNTPWTPTTTYRIPQLKFYSGSTLIGTTPNSIVSHMGVSDPFITDASGGKTESQVNALPIRGYCSIWNFYFRDQNYQYPILFTSNDSDVVYSQTVSSNHQSAAVGNELLPVNRMHDLFSSGLPEPQFGDPVRLPVNNDLSYGSSMTQTKWPFINSSGTVTLKAITSNASSNDLINGSAESTSQFLTGLPADILGTMDQFRLGYLTDLFLKRQAEYGHRYPEIIKSMYGVTAPDYLLDEPLFLGHTRFPINLSPVVQQSASVDSTYDGVTLKQSKGSISGYSATRYDSSLTVHSFVEHGFLHLLCCTRTKRSYMQNLDKYWKKRDLIDIYNPIFAALGSQPIFKWQINCMGDTVASTGTPFDAVWAYGEAWSEYRYKSNSVTGMLRQAGLYTTWTYADAYASMPYMSDSWLCEGYTNLNRTLYVQGSSTVPQFLGDFKIRCIATRPMPVHSVPGLSPYF